MAGEKRSQDCEDARDEKIIIVDIEGTTTSISFVKDTLFPYVRNNLKDYIEKNWENAEFKEDVKKIKELATKDEADKIEGFVSIIDTTTDEEKESLMKNILWQMDNDRKSGALKQLQGHIWRDAYKSGAVKGHVYEDVPKSLEAWTKDNRKVYVYSSGSVEAQKLLFDNTENGSLLKYFTDYYDTEIGEKQQSSSYKNILSKIDTEGKNVLFLTDVIKEAQAAIDAGMSSIIVIREGNVELTNEEKNKYQTIKSFEDLLFKTSTKRVKIDDTTKTDNKDVKNTDDVKKTDNVETTDVEMKDVSTPIAEKKENKEDDKAKEEPMQVEAKVTKDDVVTKEETKKSDTVVKADEKIEKKNDTVEEPIVKASTSEVKNTEKETTKETKETKKEATPVVVDDKKIEETTQVQKKTETTSSKITEEKKSDKIEETSEKIIVETEESKTKTETEVKKSEVEKTNSDTTKPEVSKTEEQVNDKKDKKDDDVTEKVNNSDEKVIDKPITEEVKQNGDSKNSTEKHETTTTTTTSSSSTTTPVTETKVTNGQKTELNGNDTKKLETIEKKETEVKVTAAKNETTKIDDDTKIEPSKKEDEKIKNDEEKQRVNGNSDDKKDKNHQNGVNEEKSKNGESSTDTESFKVKKVVEIIADGAGEAEVAPPVAVVAATS